MSSAVIENPILNSPFDEPTRHFKFDDDGITDEIVEARRRSAYFIPIPPPKKKGATAGAVQLGLAGEWTAERVKDSEFINQVRERVSAWRTAKYPNVTNITRELLEYWTDPERERKLFFCQIEALETAIYLAEVAPKLDTWMENTLRAKNEQANPGLYRIAFKMATGSGKTVVMAMLIAWQTLNKLANPQDGRFSDTFLVVTPGITIRDRLRVLYPNDPASYYVARDLVTPDQLQALQQANLLITNFHAFLRRETIEAATLTKKVLGGRSADPDRFKETPPEMVRRVLRDFGTRRNIVVLNDEAHHCYRGKPPADADPDAPKLNADERTEAKREAEAARIWLSGLEAVKAKVGIRAIYDLSATPFFLRGSGYSEGTLFPWVVSDFSLIDAIESGIVKVPRVPVSDDQMTGESPAYRDLWARIREDLPKKGRATEAIDGEPTLPMELEGALRSLYGNYAASYARWQQAGWGTPPVFIVVCNNTNVSKMVFDWIAGWQTPSGRIAPGHLDLFSNERDGAWIGRPNTLLIDSAQLESGGAMDEGFKKAAAAEIEEFKAAYARRPGADVEAITDEDLLREVMNTVGKQGQLGEQIRCVVSVSMLTEGWDANTVTHILGVRAFGTQLLCEQVVGRGLRRIDYTPNAEGRFEPEYAEVYGVPFSFIPTAGNDTPPEPRKVHRVRAMEDRAALAITFPRLLGYRYELPSERLTATFDADSRMVLSTQDLPNRTRLDPIVGEGIETSLDDLRGYRVQSVAFVLAKRVLDGFFRDEANTGVEKPWLFPQLMEIAKRWLAGCVEPYLKDGTFLQLLLIAELSHLAAERIYGAIVRGTAGEKRLMPIVRQYDAMGSTEYVDFTTTKEIWTTRPDKSHLSAVVLDSGWEAKLAETLESMPEVLSYAKNQDLNFKVPYAFEGAPLNYVPDYLIRLNDGGPEPLTLILEVTGEQKKAKRAKAEAARDLWVPAVNNDGRYGRWAFLEVTDPWDAANLIRASVPVTPVTRGA
jgi:type III restriction enzyme